MQEDKNNNRIYDFGIRDEEIDCIHIFARHIREVEDCCEPPYFTERQKEVVQNLSNILAEKQRIGS